MLVPEAPALQKPAGVATAAACEAVTPEKTASMPLLACYVVL